jgi:hypothetical protein
MHRLAHRLRHPARLILFVNHLPTDISHHYHLAKTAPTPLGVPGQTSPQYSNSGARCTAICALWTSSP